MFPRRTWGLHWPRRRKHCCTSRNARLTFAYSFRNRLPLGHRNCRNQHYTRAHKRRRHTCPWHWRRLDKRFHRNRNWPDQHWVSLRIRRQSSRCNRLSPDCKWMRRLLQCIRRWRSDKDRTWFDNCRNGWDRFAYRHTKLRTTSPRRNTRGNKFLLDKPDLEGRDCCNRRNGPDHFGY